MATVQSVWFTVLTAFESREEKPQNNMKKTPRNGSAVGAIVETQLCIRLASIAVIAIADPSPF